MIWEWFWHELGMSLEWFGSDLVMIWGWFGDELGMRWECFGNLLVHPYLGAPGPLRSDSRFHNHHWNSHEYLAQVIKGWVQLSLHFSYTSLLLVRSLLIHTKWDRMVADQKVQMIGMIRYSYWWIISMVKTLRFIQTNNLRYGASKGISSTNYLSSLPVVGALRDLEGFDLVGTAERLASFAWRESRPSA